MPILLMVGGKISSKDFSLVTDSIDIFMESYESGFSSIERNND